MACFFCRAFSSSCACASTTAPPEKRGSRVRCRSTISSLLRRYSLAAVAMVLFLSSRISRCRSMLSGGLRRTAERGDTAADLEWPASTASLIRSFCAFSKSFISFVLSSTIFANLSSKEGLCKSAKSYRVCLLLQPFAAHSSRCSHRFFSSCASSSCFFRLASASCALAAETSAVLNRGSRVRIFSRISLLKTWYVRTLFSMSFFRSSKRCACFSEVESRGAERSARSGE
mmetsp:Transcript_3452/g.6068  ORF Transcript_3452/g.6068 Transcript_3452/m.6068 type:complete len:230 (-) Transcript_3452:74-763(-)